MIVIKAHLQRKIEPQSGLRKPSYFERAISFHKTYRRPGSKIPQLDNIKQERLALFTNPPDAVAILREYEKIGVTHMICMVNFGGVPMTDVRRTLELMAKQVFPKFK